MSERRANIHAVFLPTEFYLAIADAQSKMRIGKSSAILLMICEGLRKHDFIDERVYEIYRNRYSRPLMDIVNGNREARERLVRPQIRCSWAGGSAERCRRIATVILKSGDRMVSSCSDHIEDFEKFGYVLKET